MPETTLPNFPPAANLVTEVFRPLPVVSAFPAEADNDDGPAVISAQLVFAIFDALQGSDSSSLADLFLESGAYWRDTLAFTYHLRTFSGKEDITRALTELNSQRLSKEFRVVSGSATAASAGPSLVSAASVIQGYWYSDVLEGRL